jgi:hypothetical protein
LPLLVLGSFTGPFCFVLLLIAAALFRRRREPWIATAGSLFLLGSIVQGITLLTHHRQHPNLGASAGQFVRILGGNIYLGTLLGSNSFATFWPLVCVVAIGTLILLGAAKISNTGMRALLALTSLVFAASLASPNTPTGQTAWEVLAQASHTHYWFLPTLAFVWSIAYCCFSDRQFCESWLSL